MLPLGGPQARSLSCAAKVPPASHKGLHAQIWLVDRRVCCTQTFHTPVKLQCIVLQPICVAPVARRTHTRVTMGLVAWGALQHTTAQLSRQGR